MFRFTFRTLTIRAVVTAKNKEEALKMLEKRGYNFTNCTVKKSEITSEIISVAPLTGREDD